MQGLDELAPLVKQHEPRTRVFVSELVVGDAAEDLRELTARGTREADGGVFGEVVVLP